VFTQYDPENLLLNQARREVLEQQLEISRLGATIGEITEMKIVLVETPRLTPLAFPLWASFVQANVTSEKWSERVKRMAEQLDIAAREKTT
jgi:ATP-dependent helicase Lhr and Lhr-like helicase